MGSEAEFILSLSSLELFSDFMEYSLLSSSVHGFPWQEYCSGLPFPCSEHLTGPRDGAQVFCIGRRILYH